jgi:hypothetical protein
MRGRLHGDCCFTPLWPTLTTSEGLVHVPADAAAWAAHTARPRTAGSAVIWGLDTGAELILIIVLLAGGIIYATFASNPMSFDDLIELRFLPSRRRPRDLEYFEQLKSTILPNEVEYRVSGDKSGPQQARSRSRTVKRSSTRRSSPTHHDPALY